MRHVIGMVYWRACCRTRGATLTSSLPTIMARLTTRALPAGSRCNFKQSFTLRSKVVLFVSERMSHLGRCQLVKKQDSWPQVLRGNKIFTNPGGNGRSSATDGDMDAAYALLLAGKKWKDQSYTERGIKVHNLLTRVDELAVCL